nr:cell division cycle and apoptosis regulator protein 1-like [Lytechinus pictus]
MSIFLIVSSTVLQYFHLHLILQYQCCITCYVLWKSLIYVKFYSVTFEQDEDSKEDDKDGVEEENEKKSIEDDDDDDEKKKGDKSKDEKSKPRVMILSCIYSDQNRCGYILERDLEEILYTIGVIYQGLR